MKSARRWLARILVFTVLLVAAGTFIPRPFWPPARAATLAPTGTILVISNPIHTDIAIPVDAALRARFAFLAEAGVPIDNPQVRYIIVGWGGRSFYLETPRWADLKPLPALRALTIDRSVLHVDVAGGIPEAAPSISRFDIDDQGFQDLLTFIEKSFAAEGQTPAAIPGAHYGRHDAFFEAKGYFNAAVGCNTWTARALREAGLRTGLWNPVPQTLALSLELFN